MSRNRNAIDRLVSHAKEALRRRYLRAHGIETNPLTHEEIKALIGKNTPVILEIGCNDGSDTLAFLNAMPGAKIYCFEPDPRAIARFRRQLGPKLGQVSLIEAAISDRTGQIEFHQSSGDDVPKNWEGPELCEGWDLSGSIRKPRNHLKRVPWVRFNNSIMVDTYQLDDWCDQNGIEQVDFIWMDVQGAEEDVISGAQTILERTRFIYTEYSDDELYEGQLTFQQLLSRLPLFEVVARYPSDVLLKNKYVI